MGIFQRCLSLVQTLLRVAAMILVITLAFASAPIIVSIGYLNRTRAKISDGVWNSNSYRKWSVIPVVVAMRGRQ